MTGFARQLGWEWRRLWRRPRTRLGFAWCLVLQLVLLGLFRLPAVREAFVQQVWRVRVPIDRSAAFSGLSLAIQILAETTIYGVALFLTLVAGDVVAKEVEDGTLRMVLARPVSRGRVFAQKLLVCVVYTVLLVTFATATAFVLGLVVEGAGKVLILVPRDNLAGLLEFDVALRRYWLALPVTVAGMLTMTVLAFTLSCLPMKPGTATVLALAVLFADWMIHTHPSFAPIAPYCLTMRIGIWRALFNDDVPWLRIARNLRQLFWIDAVLVVIAWEAMRRRALRPR